MSRQAKFWNKMAEGYSKKPIDDEDSYQKKLKRTQELLKPDMEIMEFGCGTGSTALIHAPHVKHILATDFSSKMIAIAKEKAQQQEIKNVSFKCSSIDDLNIPNDSLDMVLGLSILHLLKNREETIQKTYDMVKPGGFFVTSTVCMADKSPIFKFLVPIGRLFGLTLKAFKAKELEDNLVNAGFKIYHSWRPENAISVFIIAQKPT